MPKRLPMIDLRTLVLGIVVLACLATLGNALYVAYRVQYNTLVQFSCRPTRRMPAKWP